MQFHQSAAELFIPDRAEERPAFGRTTHLAIGAHHDDLEFMAYHGIAECYDRDDRFFGGVVVTDGGGSARAGEFAEATDAAMKRIRAGEQRDAAEIGRYGFMATLAVPSSEVKDQERPEVTDELQAILQAATPEVLYLHNPADKHDTHIAVLHRCIEALRRLPKDIRPKQVLGCEVWRSLDWLPDDLKVALDVSAHPELRKRLVEQFKSQIAGGKRYDLAVEGRWLANATFFDSHQVDASPALHWAIDMTELAKDDSLDPVEFISQRIQQLRTDVQDRWQKIRST